jgi:hypothetical protein
MIKDMILPVLQGAALTALGGVSLYWAYELLALLWNNIHWSIAVGMGACFVLLLLAAVEAVRRG